MGKPKILIVDDKPQNLISLEVLLEDMGLEFIRAYSGSEALEKTLEHEFCMALIDVQMPEMDGYETVQLMRKVKKTRNLPVIFVSAIYSENYHIVKGIESGAVDFISKPISPPVLKGKVRIFMDLYNQKKELELEIEQRKLLEERQSELLKELSFSNNELMHFAHVVSHDLKTPLRGIGSLAQWIAQDYADVLDDEGKRELGLMTDQVKKMHDLLDDLLQYSKVGHIQMEKEYLNLDEIVNEVINTVPASDNVEIKVIKSLPQIYSDRACFTQIFYNLLNNAIIFMDKPQGEVCIDYTDDGDNWIFQVRDNGAGIEEKDFDRIFQIFQTAYNRDDINSRGIGLATVKKITETFKGKVWVESVFGNGSSFFVQIPK